MIDWFYTSEMQSCRYTRYWTPQTSILHNNLCLSMICSYNGVEKFCWYCLICYVHMNLCTRLTAASDKVYQLLAHGRCFSPVTPASSTTKTCRHDIHVVEILLKVALSTINEIKWNQINHIYIVLTNYWPNYIYYKVNIHCTCSENYQTFYYVCHTYYTLWFVLLFQ
jgi:hypothetical protein